LIASFGFGNTSFGLNDLTFPVNFHQNRIRVGAQNMPEIISKLEGQRVAIVGNQSSLVDNMHLVDTLLSSKINIMRVFSPEHGFRGDADAGESVINGMDSKTGLEIVSLYGDNKKPTAEQLVDIDILVFDIQDVGVRFYTYISTLHYVMEACAENGVCLIILDRPNPNGHYVDGPVLNLKFKSFVGMHPIPIVHGMTIAEYAQMINGEKWLKDSLQCDLILIPCQDYSHHMSYSLPVPPSPNLRSDLAIQLYPSLCLFEATSVSIGRGTDFPFEVYGHPDFVDTEFSFTPVSGYGSKDPKHQNILCYGYHLTRKKYKRMRRLDLSFLLNASSLLIEKTFIERERFFNLLAGNDILIEQLKNDVCEEDIRDSWNPELKEFKKMREKYLLYD